MDLFATRFNNNYIFVSPVADPQARAVEVLSLPREDLDLHAFPPAAFLGKWGRVAGPPVQQTPTDCTRVVQRALVLGPGDHVKSDPTVCTFCLTFGSAIQPDPSQEPGKSESTCLALRAPTPKEAGLP